MVRYRCFNCRYVYEVKPGRKLPEKCPYCSKSGTLQAEQSAQDLLNEVVVDDD